VSAKAPFYRGVRGSAALATRPIAEAAPAAEALEPGELRRVPYGGELLGAVRVRGSFAALPLDAFDRACGALEAEEQAAYLQLLRLSVGEGRNWCRVAKRDLEARLRLSERRLLRVLDALVAKRFLRPLHRDNRGTLWRVYLPAEAFGEPLGDDVLVGRATELKLVRGSGGRGTTPTATPTGAAFGPSLSPRAAGGEGQEEGGNAGHGASVISTPSPRPSPPQSGGEGGLHSRSTPTSTPTSTSTPTPTPTPTSTSTSTPTSTSTGAAFGPSLSPRAAGGEGQGEGGVAGHGASVISTPSPRSSPPQSGGEGVLHSTSTSTSTANATATSTSTANANANATPVRRGPRRVHTEESLARALAAARGRSDAAGLAAAARQVAELLAEGQRPDRIAAAVEAVRRRAARAAPEDTP
jgi:hypothetical protein